MSEISFQGSQRNANRCVRDFGRCDRCAMVGSLAWGVSRRFGWGRDGGTWKGSRDHVIVWRCWEDVWLGISFVAERCMVDRT